MDDKSRDFRGIWRTQDGNYATVTEPILDEMKFCVGWMGNLFDSKGMLVSSTTWYSNGVSPYSSNNDLIERKRGTENWPPFQMEFDFHRGS